MAQSSQITTVAGATELPVWRFVPTSDGAAG